MAIPLVSLRPRFGLLLVAAGLLAVMPGGAALVVATNQPVFCNSCHEMSLHYATWRQSAHRDVTCEECHLMPGMVSMLKGKLAAARQVRLHLEKDVEPSAIQGHVPDENCRRCHPSARNLVTYHGLKITHKDHWEMGVSCTFCHDRVAHGPRWQYEGASTEVRLTQATTPSKYTPTMETCYTCHDGQNAPNTCSTCHVTLGERRATRFDPEWVVAHKDEVQHAGRQDCLRCHQETFCDRCHKEANPHPSDWMPQHPQEMKGSPERCFTCHLAPGEKRPQDAAELAFCRACHSLRRQHSGADWTGRHGKQSLADPSSCTHCHEQSWCADCHSLSRIHPAEWRIRHVAEASSERQNCDRCHKSDFCDACHRGEKGKPDSHNVGWLAQHKGAAGRGSESCQTCHEVDFCQACHRERPPASHDSHWLARHGLESGRDGSACLLCHEERNCNECHGMDMPHPKLWLASHHKAASENRKQCESCHRKDACDTCHRGAFPDSHRSSEWGKQHGAAAKVGGKECYRCHRQALCDACHGLEMPHASGWEGEAHGKVGQRNSDVCSRCHPEDQCGACHRLTMPHPGDWVSKHGASAVSSPATCSNCHAAASEDCGTCHRQLAPRDHREAQWSKQHAVAGASNLTLCALCHGKNACVDCHERRAAKG